MVVTLGMPTVTEKRFFFVSFFFILLVPLKEFLFFYYIFKLYLNIHDCYQSADFYLFRLWRIVDTCLVFDIALVEASLIIWAYLWYTEVMNPLTLVKRIQNINSREAALGISEEASWHAKYKDSAYVYAGGIPFDLTEGDLLAIFAQ